jgi:hypothetical protein
MSRRALGLLVATVLAGGLAMAIPWLASAARGGGLRWASSPKVFDVPGMASDRVLSGQVVNTSTHPIYVDARTIAVVDDRGHRLETAARFLAAFAHPLFSPMQFHTIGGTYQLQRLGVVVRIEPGQRMPLTVSWRLKPAGDSPTAVDVGTATLSIPD